MKPGHGEQLIAEGDIEIADEEERLVEVFRRQLPAAEHALIMNRSLRRIVHQRQEVE